MSKQVESNAAIETPAADEQEIIVCKIATCESLSGLSQLEYHVGYVSGTTDSILIRIWKNSGGGKFNQDWVSLADIEKALSHIPLDQPFNASAFQSVLIGKSINTHSFVAAACLSEGLIVRAANGARSYRRHNAEEWWQATQALISAGTNLEVPAMDKHGVNTPEAHSSEAEVKGKPTKKKPAGVMVQPVE